MARILVVDDEPDILLLHRLNLEAAGHHVILAADGSRALDRIDNDKPDVVVLDVMMPVLDGWGVLDELRSRAAGPPVLVVSAKSSWDDIVRAVEGGAADYLSKPFQTEALIAAVERLVTADVEVLERRRSELLGE